MKYRITLADPSRDHWISQSHTGSSLRKAGFTEVKWTMGTTSPGRDESLHSWYCYGDKESLVILKLSANVERVEEILEEKVL